MAKTVLVTGATGTVGRDLAKLLSKKGAAVRAGVRDQAKARQRFDDDIGLVTFDFENEGSFAAALDGVGKVFLLPPLLLLALHNLPATMRTGSAPAEI